MTPKMVMLICFLALSKASLTESGYLPTPEVYHSSFHSSPIVIKTITGPIKKTVITPTVYSTAAPVHYETVISTEENKFKTLDGAKHSTFTKSIDTGYSDKYDSHVANDDFLNHNFPVLYATQANPVYYHHGDNLDNQAIHNVVSPHITTAYSSPLSKTILNPSVSHDYYVSSGNTKTLTPYAYSSFSKIPTSSVLYNSPIGISSNDYYSPLTRSQPSQYATYNSYVTSTDKSNFGAPTYTSQTKTQVPFLTYGPPAVDKSSNHISHGPVGIVKSTTTYSESPVVSHLSFSGLGTNYGW